MGEEQWLIISDIDETLKTTSTLSLAQYVSHLLFPQPVLGMPDVFRLLSKTFTPKFFYLSAGPELLRPHYWYFLRSYYPPGSIILAPWTFGVTLWTDANGALMTYKTQCMSQILREHPRGRVLCVGDDSRTDLDAYLWARKRYPGRIERIFIRDTGVPERRTRTANKIRHLDHDTVHTFSTVEELEVDIHDVMHSSPFQSVTQDSQPQG